MKKDSQFESNALGSRENGQETAIPTVLLPCGCRRLPNHGAFIYFCEAHCKQIDDLTIIRDMTFSDITDRYDLDDNDLPIKEEL